MAGATGTDQVFPAVPTADPNALGSDLFAPAPPPDVDPFDSAEPLTAPQTAPAESMSSAQPPPAPPIAQASPAPEPTPPRNDPEADLRTSVVSADRQAGISTRLIEAPPVVETAEAPQQKGLPDSRVARGVEDNLLDIKRMLFRMGRSGRLALWSYMLVVIGCVAPWYYLRGEGFTPGLEVWGWVPLVLCVAAISTLVWRHQRQTGMRVLPVLLHLVLAAAVVLTLLWRYQEFQDIPPHLRPDLAFGYYMAGVGSIGASLGALIGLKDVR